MKNKNLNFIFIITGAFFILTSCLTVNAKKIMDPPYTPPVVESSYDAGEAEKAFNVYYSTSEIPVIDGQFDEWKGLVGVHTRRMVYGGLFNPENTAGVFILRTDGENLYLFAKITDDYTEGNTFSDAQAWRGCSIDYFFGSETCNHSASKNN